MFGLKKKPRRSPRVTSLTHLFHGVEIIPCSNACAPVKALQGSRLLSEEAPRLPLASCPHSDQCECKYKHYVDRRTQARRESDEGLPPRSHYPQDKRDGSGRRITDH